MATNQRAAAQQHKYLVPGAAFDDAHFDASQSFRKVEGSQAMIDVAPAATPVLTVPAATVFAGMTAKLTTWRFAEDSWRTDDE